MKHIAFVVALVLGLPALAARNVPGPLTMSGRYIVDANSNPVYLHCDTPWSMMVELTEAEADTYLTAAVDNGFNCIQVNLIEYKFGGSCNCGGGGAPDGCQNQNNDCPFDTWSPQADFTDVNSDYWDHVDALIDKATNKYGLIVFAVPAYLGYQCNAVEGWCNEINGAGETNLNDYGEWLGTRYGANDRIIWVAGGDTCGWDSTVGGEMNELMVGIETNDANSLKTGHAYQLDSGQDCHVDDETGGYDTSWFNFDTAYTAHHANDTCYPHSAEHKQSYDDAAIPYVMIEGLYENENNIPAGCLRRQLWGPLLDGAAGSFFGNNPIWPFDQAPSFCTSTCTGGWENYLSTEGQQDQEYLLNVIPRFPWSTMSPDWSGTMVTTGKGTIGNDTYVPALYSTTHGLAYTPSTTITVALSVFSGADYVDATWLNPRTGAETVIGTYATTGSQAFDPSGTTDDYLLMIEPADGTNYSGASFN